MAYTRPPGDQIHFVFDGSYVKQNAINLIANFTVSAPPPTLIPVDETILTTTPTCASSYLRTAIAITETFNPCQTTIVSVICITRVSYLPETILRIYHEVPTDPLLRIDASMIMGLGIFPPELQLTTSTSANTIWDLLSVAIPQTELPFQTSVKDIFLKSHTFQDANYNIVFESGNGLLVEPNLHIPIRFGNSCSLNDKGTILAVGSEEMSSGASYDGGVIVYDISNPTAWRALYARFGEYSYVYFGHDVSLSADGIRLGVCAKGDYVELYRSGSRAITLYGIIRTPYYYPKSVSLNGDGSIVVIGHAGDSGEPGAINIYSWNGYYEVNIISRIVGNAQLPYIGNKVAVNKSGNRIVATSDRGIHTFDLIDNVWVQHPSIITASTDYFKTKITLANDGNTLAVPYSSSVYLGAEIYDWADGWVKRGCNIKYASQPNLRCTAAALNDDGNVLFLGFPQGLVNTVAEGLVHRWNDNTIYAFTREAEFSVITTCDRLIGAGECYVPEVYLFARCSMDSIQILIKIDIPQTLLSCGTLYEFRETIVPSYTLRNTFNNISGGVTLSKNGRILVVSNSPSLLTVYDLVVSSWVLRHTIPVNNTSISLNEIGTTLVVGDSVAETITTYFYNGFVWTSINVLSNVLVSSLCFKGTTLAVGSETFDNKGKVEIYVWTMGSWVLRDTLLGNINNERYGISVALAVNNTMLCVAAKMNDLYATPPNIYTYDYNGSEWVLRGKFEVDENSVLHLTNLYREEYGVAPVKSNRCLMDAAYKYSQKMGVNNWFAHNEEDGTTPFDRIRAEGYWNNFDFGLNQFCGENLYRVVNDIDYLVVEFSSKLALDWWRHSHAGHAENMRDTRYTELSVGIWRGTDFIYYTQNYGWRDDGTSMYFNGETNYNHTVSISLNSTGTTLAVGSTEFDYRYSHTGGVQIFSSFGDVWIRRGKYIISENEMMDGFFGSSVVLSASGRELIVGASGESNVYVFAAIPDTYKVGGIIKQGVDGVSAKARAVVCRTGQSIGDVITNEDGTFEIDNLLIGEEVDVVFHNPLTMTTGDVIERVYPVQYVEEEL